VWDPTKQLAREEFAANRDVMPTNPLVSIDGAEVPHMESFFVEQRRPYRFTIPELTGEPLGPAGSYYALDYSWTVMLRPLSPGEHIVVVSDMVPNVSVPGTVTFDLARITYHLHVH
jgi:hypothetical protein